MCGLYISTVFDNNSDAFNFKCALMMITMMSSVHISHSALLHRQVTPWLGDHIIYVHMQNLPKICWPIR